MQKESESTGQCLPHGIAFDVDALLIVAFFWKVRKVDPPRAACKTSISSFLYIYIYIKDITCQK